MEKVGKGVRTLFNRWFIVSKRVLTPFSLISGNTVSGNSNAVTFGGEGIARATGQGGGTLNANLGQNNVVDDIQDDDSPR